MQSRRLQTWHLLMWLPFLGLLASMAQSSEVSRIPERGLPPQVDLQRVRSESYSYSYDSHFKAPFDKVIRNAAQWKRLWRTMCPEACDADPMASVDFNQYDIVVSALGLRPTGGFSIILSTARWTEQGLEIDVVEQFPSPHCVLTMVASSAIDIATIAKTKKPIVFRHRRVENVC